MHISINMLFYNRKSSTEKNTSISLHELKVPNKNSHNKIKCRLKFRNVIYKELAMIMKK